MVDYTVAPRQRINAVDRLRGLVIVIMALDHVRDFFSVATFAPEDLTTSNTGYFFTRWVTHFCAPVFVLLSGASAWLYRGNRGVSSGELARFLLSRGIWLIFLELTVITFFWQFAYNVVIVQVIWAIGWSMIALAGLIFLPRAAILTAGLVMIGGHNLLDGITSESMGSFAWLWTLLHVSAFIPLPELPVVGAFVGYPLIPWVGVMAVGYAMGGLFDLPPEKRNRLFVMIGLAATVAFLFLRGFDLYGEPGLGPADDEWSSHDRGVWFAMLSFLNTTKYPPSLHYLLMTLGPAIALLPWLERWSGRAADIVSVYGRVPFLFYVLHLPLINGLSHIWSKLTFGTWGITFFSPQSWPQGYEPSLLRCYLVWALVVALLYYPCRAFVEYRKTHRQWWLSYI